MTLCPVCGNESAGSNSVCTFCGCSLVPSAAASAAPIPHRIINIEQGRPVVETALKRMESELARARAEKVRVVTLIHGYGSSGKGGRIKTECRKVLDYLSRHRKINLTIEGEEFRKRTGPGKELLRRFPELERDCASDFSNPGVTIIVL